MIEPYKVGDFLTLMPNNGTEGRYAAVLIDDSIDDTRVMFLSAKAVKLLKHTGYKTNAGWFITQRDQGSSYSPKPHEPTDAELAVWTRYCLTGEMPGIDYDN